MVDTAAMPVLPPRARRTSVALAALAVLMLTTGQSCADATNGTGSSHSAKNAGSTTKDRHHTSGKSKSGKDDYDEYGYNQAGYDRDGYDRKGYDENGYDRDGYNKSGYNNDGYDRYGHDSDGFDESGCNRAGYDSDGDECDSDGGSHGKHKDDDES